MPRSKLLYSDGITYIYSVGSAVFLAMNSRNPRRRGFLNATSSSEIALLSRKRNRPLNRVWKFGSKVKRRLPTQSPKRYHSRRPRGVRGIRRAINPRCTLLNRAWETRDTFQRNRPGFIPRTDAARSNYVRLSVFGCTRDELFIVAGKGGP